MGAACHTISGNPAKIFSPAIMPVESLKLHFSPSQEGSGDPSTVNVRPINGRTSIECYKAGRNLFDKSTGIELTERNMLVARNRGDGKGVPFLLKGGTTYTMSCNNTTVPPSEITFRSPYGSDQYAVTWGRYYLTYTPAEDLEVSINFYWADGRPTDATDIQIEIGSVMTPFETYGGATTTIPVTFQSTGKNLFNPVNVLNAYVGTKIVSGSAYRTAIIPVRPGKTYTISKGSGSRLRVAFTTNTPQIGDDVFGFISNDTLNFTVTAPDGANYMCVYCVYTGEDANTILSTLQVEIGSVATAYVAYDASTTCYGGCADPAKGELTIEYIKLTVAKEQFTQAYVSGVGYRQTSAIYPPAASMVNWNVARQQQMCNKARIANPYSESPTTYTDYMGVIFTMESNTSVAYARISEALYQALEAEETVEFTYKLMHPYTVPLARQDIVLLRGSTTFWSGVNETVDATYEVVDSDEMVEARKRIIANNPKPITLIAQDVNANSFDADMRSYLKDCAVMFYPVQEGTENPSPTNVRPITGKNILRLRHTGKNMFPIIGFSASTASSKAVSSYSLTNNYGTSIDTVFGSSGQVVVTQSEAPLPETMSSYRNGYLCFSLDGMEFGKTYMLSFDITDITANPLNASLSDIVVYSPKTVQSRITIDGNRLVYRYVHAKNTSHPERLSIEIRNCGMSFTLKNIMISDINNSDYTYEPYVPITGKNLARIMGYSATTGGNNTTNSYGTSLSTVQFSGPDTPLTVTQSQAPETSNPQHYRNGYFCIDVNGLEFGKSYSVSFRISDIKSNPLNATLNDIRVCDPYGSHYTPTSLSNGRVAISNFKYNQNQSSPKITSIDIRNCGMSFTISEFMVTEVGADQTYEPCVNNTYYIEMPYIGRNLFPCREEDMVSDGWNRYFPNPFPEAGTYTISCTAAFGGTGDKGCALAFKDAPNNQAPEIGDHYLSYTFGSSTATTSRKRTFTITQEQADAPYIAFFMMSSGSTYETFKYANIQIERGSTKTFYTPYNDNTIYGAAVDIVHGIVAVTHMYTELSAVNRYENANYFFTTAGELALGNIADTNAGLMCNRLNPKINTTETDTDPVISFYHNNIIRWVDPDYLSMTSANDYNDATAGNRVKIVYQLADPIFVQIEPQQIKSLLGNNTFSAEGNSIVAIRYWKY